MQEAAAERERLRRALYRPGAGDAERQRYERAAAEAVPALPQGDPAPGPRSPARDARARRWPRRAPSAALPAVAVLVVAGGLLAWPVAAGSAPGPTPSASATPAPSGSPDAVRAVWRPDVRALGTAYTDAGVVQSFHGRGPATAVLDADALPGDGGRLSVVLAPSDTALVGWQVRRAVPVDGASDQLIAARSVTERRGVAVPIEFPYDGGAPDRVRVDAPDGVAWTLVVTALRGATPR